MSEWPLGDDAAGWPSVSVVLPIRNEAASLADSIDAVLAQDYPRPLEVVIAVAPSSDDTDAIAQRLTTADPRVRVVANPAGVTPAGLNAAIAASTGEVVVRVDGHCTLSPGYIRVAVETMAATGAVNVGGIQHAVGTTAFSEAVAAAMTSRFGTGGARFHIGGEPGPVDTVYLGVFRRDALVAAGGFDETLVRNQDYELNIRLRRDGGSIWFTPELSATYAPRPDAASLARQYVDYGWWKAVVARRHPDSLKLRQLIPVAATVAIAVSLIAALWTRAALVIPAGYGATVLAASAAQRRISTQARLRLPAVFAIMHLAWGAGFVASIVRRGTAATR